jgi:hypothetical protein
MHIWLSIPRLREISQALIFQEAERSLYQLPLPLD